jgi:4-oxalocrotonate tautomerase
MAYVNVRIGKNNSIERKRKLVKAMTDALVSALDTKSESIIIHIEEVEREDWGIGGTLNYDKNNNRNDDRQDRNRNDDKQDRNRNDDKQDRNRNEDKQDRNR